MKKTNKVISIIILTLLLFNIITPVLAKDSKSQTIHLKNKADLMKFSKNCSFDKYSEGLEVFLDNDIDLEEEGFSPIPIFKGSFNGKGNTIKGLLIQAEGSSQGFFRYLEKEAIVKDIHLEGVVTPSGDRENIGGIVGYNKGLIEGSSFSGIVRGKNTVGGIVGFNSSTGMIKKSKFNGIGYGERKVGGIAGLNGGGIQDSLNSASINTTVEEEKIDIQNITTEDISFSKVFTDATDIGGIAGANTGLIKDSKNQGQIGYSHVGYNIGGVAGRQSGHINNCENHGEILGRKDVGGIVGQMEPYVDMQMAPSKLRQLRKELNGLQGSISKMINKIRLVSNIMDENLLKIQKDIEKGMDRIKDLMDYSGEIGDLDLKDIFDLFPDDINIDDIDFDDIDWGDIEDLPDMGDLEGDYQKAREGLFDSIEDISTSFNDFIKVTKKESNIMIDEIEAMTNQLFTIMNIMFEIIEDVTTKEPEIEDIVKDTSRENIDKKIEGKVLNSKNHGNIEADLNVGGIAGAMSIDLELDPEDDIKLQGKFTANTIFESRAIVDKCENYGSIVGKKNHVGGIVGNMELGYIKDSLAYSDVKSISGNYVGGIGGRSLGPVDSCYSRTNLSGGNYVGGITGFGKEVLNSYSLIKVEKGKAYIGAIAGNKDVKSTIKGNYFVSDDLSGIDGISYRDRAEPISYKKLIDIKDIPSMFKDFRLHFWADNRLVETKVFNYGDDLSQMELPEIPAKEDKYGKWEEIDFSDLKYDRKIEAQYIPYITLLESPELREGALPIILVEGKFTDGDRLKVTQPNSLEEYRIRIPDDGSSSHTIRYLPTNKKDSFNIFLLEGEDWKRHQYKRDGKYLVFETNGNDVSFKAIKAEKLFKEIHVIVFIIFIIILVLLFKLLKRKKKRLVDEKSN